MMKKVETTSGGGLNDPRLHPKFDRPVGPNFEGVIPETDHRSVGPHRAWCLECSSWCYPSHGCLCCAEPLYEWRIAELETRLRDLLLEYEDIVVRSETSFPTNPLTWGAYTRAREALA